MKTTIQTIRVIQTIIDQMSLKGFSGQEIKKIVKFSQFLEEEVRTFLGAQQKILKSYNVEEINGGYDWTNHKDEKAITEKLNDLISVQIDISKVSNFLSEDSFYNNIDTSLIASQIKVLAEILIKIDEEVIEE